MEESSIGWSGIGFSDSLFGPGSQPNPVPHGMSTSTGFVMGLNGMAFLI
jgi:hypothetical protein